MVKAVRIHPLASSKTSEPTDKMPHPRSTMGSNLGTAALVDPAGGPANNSTQNPHMRPPLSSYGSSRVPYVYPPSYYRGSGRPANPGIQMPAYYGSHSIPVSYHAKGPFSGVNDTSRDSERRFGVMEKGCYGSRGSTFPVDGYTSHRQAYLPAPNPHHHHRFNPHLAYTHHHNFQNNDENRKFSVSHSRSMAPVLLRHPSGANSVDKSTDKEAVARSERSLPLQTIQHNEKQEKNKDAKTDQIPPIPPGSVDKEKKKFGISMKFLKSPVTMCFERMLGAANYLANNPTPDHVRKKLSAKLACSSDEYKEGQEDSKTKEASDDEDCDEVCTSWNKRKADEQELSDEDNSVLDLPPPKRIRGLKPYVPSAEDAAKIAELDSDNPFLQIFNDEDLYHQVILNMTLESETKEAKRPSERQEEVPSVINEGFYWRDYPELEDILYANMESYYKISSANRQSRFQQEFNNQLVAAIREVAAESGYTFDPSFNDRRLRDRIRCFYKTHLQNAKKRLATMQKHPQSIMNQSQLRVWIQIAREQSLSAPQNEEDA